jgi:simple sugar transport system permease protein
MGMKYRVRIERRLDISPSVQIGAVIFSLVCAFVVIALIFYFLGVDPLNAYRRILIGGFGSIYGLSESLTKAIPLLLGGVGLALAFRARVYNIGQKDRS